MIIHQSDLSSFMRCPEQYRLSRTAPRESNSALAFGSVMHHALHVLERYHDLTAALDSFTYYWHPARISEICEPVPPDGWLPRQSYSELRVRGLEMLRRYHDLSRYDEHEVLALEYEFTVDIPGTPHQLAGTVDRLATRPHKRATVLCVDDWKTGKEQAHLRHNMQGTGYAMATTQRAFWDGFGVDADALHARFADAPRRFTWINLRTAKFQDGGFREQRDYARFAAAVTELARMIDAGIYPLNLSGETCTYCPFRSSCKGLPLPDDDADAGAP